MLDESTPHPFEKLQASLRQFAAARRWERYHDPKNLAMAIAGEAGELSAELQWLTTDEATALEPDVKGRVAREAADVLIYLVHLADVLEVDLVEEALTTAKRNEERFPMAAKERE